MTGDSPERTRRRRRRVLVAAALLLPLAIACARSGAHPAASVAADAATPGAHRIEAATFADPSYHRDRHVWAYLPPGYSRDHAPYPVAYVLDGHDYLEDLALPATLDALVAAGRVPPLVAILVDNGTDRLGDLANHAAFADAMAALVPWARARWNLAADPARTVVVGYSAGGLGAAFVALAHPELFGHVLAQSGAFWRGPEGSAEPFEWLTAQVTARERAPLTFYLEVGGDESQRALGSGPVFVEANRRLRDALVARGYPVDYVEVPGAHHEPGHWKAALPAALEAVAGKWR